MANKAKSTRRTAFRFMVQSGADLRSANGNLTWPLPQDGKPGKWVYHVDPMRLCRSGLHASTTPYYAFANRQGYVLAKVECDGKYTETEEGKFACSKMRVVQVYSHKHLVALAGLSAALTLHHFEAKRPADTRPRTALEFVLRWLRGEVVSGMRSVADAAWAARNECWNAYAAYAADAAYAAAYAAYAAADAAADAAAAAAAAAADAAAAAADSADAAYAAAAYAAAYAADAAARRTFIEKFDELTTELLETPEGKLADRVALLIPEASKAQAVQA